MSRAKDTAINCKNCNKEFDVSESRFRTDTVNPGPSSVCPNCRNEQNRSSEQHRRLDPLYVDKRLSYYKGKMRQYNIEERYEPFQVYKPSMDIISVQNSALQRNIFFDNDAIDEMTEVMDNACYYCNYRNGDALSGLDRKDSSVGYTLANIVPCCGNCNFVKGAMNQDRFLKFINEFAENNQFEMPKDCHVYTPILPHKMSRLLSEDNSGRPGDSECYVCGADSGTDVRIGQALYVLCNRCRNLQQSFGLLQLVKTLFAIKSNLLDGDPLDWNDVSKKTHLDFYVIRYQKDDAIHFFVSRSLAGVMKIVQVSRKAVFDNLVQDRVMRRKHVSIFLFASFANDDVRKIAKSRIYEQIDEGHSDVLLADVSRSFHKELGPVDKSISHAMVEYELLAYYPVPASPSPPERRSYKRSSRDTDEITPCESCFGKYRYGCFVCPSLSNKIFQNFSPRSTSNNSIFADYTGVDCVMQVDPEGTSKALSAKTCSSCGTLEPGFRLIVNSRLCFCYACLGLVRKFSLKLLVRVVTRHKRRSEWKVSQQHVKPLYVVSTYNDKDYVSTTLYDVYDNEDLRPTNGVFGQSVGVWVDRASALAIYGSTIVKDLPRLDPISEEHAYDCFSCRALFFDRINARVVDIHDERNASSKRILCPNCFSIKTDKNGEKHLECSIEQYNVCKECSIIFHSDSDLTTYDHGKPRAKCKHCNRRRQKLATAIYRQKA